MNSPIYIKTYTISFTYSRKCKLFYTQNADQCLAGDKVGVVERMRRRI